MKKTIVNGMIFIEHGDYYFIYSDIGKGINNIAVVCDGVYYYMPLLKVVPKIQYPELAGNFRGVIADDGLKIKIEKVL